MVLYRKPQIQWRNHLDTILGFLSPRASTAQYRIARHGEFWYWTEAGQRMNARPYIDREDAMRGAQRHHEERENG